MKTLTIRTTKDLLVGASLQPESIDFMPEYMGGNHFQTGSIRIAWALPSHEEISHVSNPPDYTTTMKFRDDAFERDEIYGFGFSATVGVHALYYPPESPDHYNSKVELSAQAFNTPSRGYVVAISIYQEFLMSAAYFGLHCRRLNVEISLPQGLAYNLFYIPYSAYSVSGNWVEVPGSATPFRQGSAYIRNQTNAFPCLSVNPFYEMLFSARFRTSFQGMNFPLHPLRLLTLRRYRCVQGRIL